MLEECDDHPDASSDTWTGEWPGYAECRKLGLYSYFKPLWTPCDKNHPGAGEDLATFKQMQREGDLVWDRESEEFVLTQHPRQ